MHHGFWSISLPSLHDYDVKLADFTLYEGANTRQRFSSSFLVKLHVNRVIGFQLFKTGRQMNGVGIRAMEIKTVQIHFLGEDFAAVVVTWSRGMGCPLLPSQIFTHSICSLVSQY